MLEGFWEVDSDVSAGLAGPPVTRARLGGAKMAHG